MLGVGICMLLSPLGVVTAGEAIRDVKIDMLFKRFVLTNGLTLIVHEDHKAPIVAVNVWYHVGSKNGLFG
jgi:zinc protease